MLPPLLRKVAEDTVFDLTLGTDDEWTRLGVSGLEGAGVGGAGVGGGVAGRRRRSGLRTECRGARGAGGDSAVSGVPPGGMRVVRSWEGAVGSRCQWRGLGCEWE